MRATRRGRRLEAELDARGFFVAPDMRAGMVRNGIFGAAQALTKGTAYHLVLDSQDSGAFLAHCPHGAVDTCMMGPGVTNSSSITWMMSRLA